MYTFLLMSQSPVGFPFHSLDTWVDVSTLTSPNESRTACPPSHSILLSSPSCQNCSRIQKNPLSDQLIQHFETQNINALPPKKCWVINQWFHLTAFTTCTTPGSLQWTEKLGDLTLVFIIYTFVWSNCGSYTTQSPRFSKLQKNCRHTFCIKLPKNTGGKQVYLAVFLCIFC